MYLGMGLQVEENSQDEVTNIVGSCNSITLSLNKVDTITCTLTSEGVYSMKALLDIAYTASFNRALPPEVIKFI